MAAESANILGFGNEKPNRPGNCDIGWGLALAAVFVLHVVITVQSGLPGWLCLFVDWGPVLWPFYALFTAGHLLWRAFARRGRHQRIGRIAIAPSLSVFATDLLTGGDSRWFELAMRRQLQSYGGATALQQWAQAQLSSPQRVAALESGAPVLPTDMPAAIRNFCAVAVIGGVPSYRLIDDTGPYFGFYEGGHGFCYGAMVGRTDLANPIPNGRWGGGWVKQLQPGVFIFHFSS